MHARLDHGAVQLLTRTGLDWTHKYPAIAKAVAALDARQAYLDGELCGVGPDGLTLVQHRPARFGQRQRRRRSCSFCSIFSTSTARISAARPLIERKERLRTLLANAAPCLH